MGCDIRVNPRPKHRVSGIGTFKPYNRRGDELGLCKMWLDLRQYFLIRAVKLGANFGKSGFNTVLDILDPVFMDRNFDAGFVFVVAPPKQVPNRNNGFQIGQKVRDGQKVAKHLANHRGAPQTATHDDLKADIAIFAHHPQPDVMGTRHGTIMFGACYGNFEFARQELKFGVIC